MHQTNVEIDPRDANTATRKKAVYIAIAASVSVAVVQLIIGWLWHLESLIAEGIHTFLDGIDSVIVLITIFLAAKPADREHQFGHGKFEALGAGIEGLFVLGAGIGIAYRAVNRLIEGAAPETIRIETCAILVVMAIFYYGVSIYLKRIAEETGSPAVFAEAMHLRTHIYINGGLALGLLAGALGDWPLADTLLALGVAVCLLGIAWQVLREVWSQMMDLSLPRKELDAIAEMVEPFGERFIEVHGLRTRKAGVERHIEMHLVVSPDTKVASAHELSHEIEEVIVDKWPAAHVTVHMEPLNQQHDESGTLFDGEPKVRTDDDSPLEREFLH